MISPSQTRPETLLSTQRRLEPLYLGRHGSVLKEEELLLSEESTCPGSVGRGGGRVHGSEEGVKSRSEDSENTGRRPSQVCRSCVSKGVSFTPRPVMSTTVAAIVISDAEINLYMNPWEAEVAAEAPHHVLHAPLTLPNPPPEEDSMDQQCEFSLLRGEKSPCQGQVVPQNRLYRGRWQKIKFLCPIHTCPAPRPGCLRITKKTGKKCSHCALSDEGLESQKVRNRLAMRAVRALAKSKKVEPTEESESEVESGPDDEDEDSVSL